MGEKKKPQTHQVFDKRGQLFCRFKASSGKCSKERAIWQRCTFKLKWLISAWHCQAKYCLFFLFVCLFVLSSLVVQMCLSHSHPQFCLSTSSSTGCEFRRGLLFVYPPCALFSVLITMPVPFYKTRWLLEEEGAWTERGEGQSQDEREREGEMDKGKCKW